MRYVAYWGFDKYGIAEIHDNFRDSNLQNSPIEDSPRTAHRAYLDNIAQHDEVTQHNYVNPDRILSGYDVRTTVMMRNIPNDWSKVSDLESSSAALDRLTNHSMNSVGSSTHTFLVNMTFSICASTSNARRMLAMPLSIFLIQPISRHSALPLLVVVGPGSITLAS